MDVYLNETSNAVQPDLVIVLKEQSNIIYPDGHIHGVPAILIEILLKGNNDHDLIRKKDLYERIGVQEYHAVDPVVFISCWQRWYRSGKHRKAVVAPAASGVSFLRRCRFYSYCRLPGTEDQKPLCGVYQAESLYPQDSGIEQ